MTQDERLLCWMWLQATLGFASERAGEVLACFGTGERAFAAREGKEFAQLLAPAQRKRAAQSCPEDFATTLAICRKKGISLLPWDAPEYPLALARQADAPVVLYCTGDAFVLNARSSVGMVGSRRADAYGVQAAQTFGGAFAAAGLTIISGLADGLDSEAHRAALDGGAPTVAVLGCSIERTYPASNASLRARIEKDGAVLSEYPPGVPTGRRNFVQRNRLIAALSDVLCVLEARERSGTLSTAARAYDYRKPVYAVPGSVFNPLSEGTNRLIRDGHARALLCAEDVLGPMGLAERFPQPMPSRPTRRPAAVPLSQEAKVLLQALSNTPQSQQALMAGSGLDFGALLAALTELETAEKILPLAGRQYVLRI